MFPCDALLAVVQTSFSFLSASLISARIQIGKS